MGSMLATVELPVGVLDRHVSFAKGASPFHGTTTNRSFVILSGPRRWLPYSLKMASGCARR